MTFWARTGRKTGGDREDCEPVSLPGPEFVQRWSLHILPKGFVKSRRFGGYSNRHRERYVAACADLHSVGVPPVSRTPPLECPAPTCFATDDEVSRDATERTCAACGKRMQCIADRQRDDWFVVMTGPARPRWYLDGS